MAILKKQIPDENVVDFYKALAWSYGGYPETIGITDEETGEIEIIPNPENIYDWVARKFNENMDLQYKRYQKYQAINGLPVPKNLGITEAE